MLKQGLMRIGSSEYTLYELQSKGFHRLDIVRKGAELQFDVSAVLFSFYKKKRRRQIGDALLYQKYSDTVTFIQKLQFPVQEEAKWVNGAFVQTEQKGAPGQRFVSESQNGFWYCDIYELNDVFIIMRFIDDSDTVLIPANDRCYRYSVPRKN